MTLLVAQARVALDHPEETLNKLSEHLLEHGVEARREADAWSLAHDGGLVRIGIGADTLDIRAEAPGLDILHNLKLLVAGHLMEYAPQLREVPWTGDGSGLSRPPAFRALRVTAARELTRHLRRITLAGDDLARYAGLENLHCKLLLPQPGQTDPEWPTLSPSGLPIMPQGEQRLDMRTYTIRHIDAAAGTLEIDMVVHEPAGPGGEWARRARPGDPVGMLGPGGRGAKEADWYLLAGDETALPAIARILEHLPAAARGEALLETQHEGERLGLKAPPGVRVRWLLRGDQSPGTTRLLPEAVRAAAWPEAGTRVFAWAGVEFDAFRAIRSYLRNERDLTPAEHLVVAYWRRGHSETELKKRDKGD